MFIPGAGSNSGSAEAASEVEYRVTFKGMWNLQSTPGGVVGGAHFTTLIGAVHNSSVTHWESGGMATAGVENVAELGSTSTFRSEINTSGDKKLSLISASGTGAEGTRTFDIDVTSDYPLVTLLSMIGPSPDWFVGISGVSLLDGNGEWRHELVINLYPYDAGTEEGEEFSLSNPSTNPQEPITSIRNTGKFSNSPMATLTFTLTTTPPSATAPGKPPTPVVTPGDTQLTVRWSPPSDNGGTAITSYDLQYRRRGIWGLATSAWRSGDGALVHTISHLLNGVTYDILVRAVNSVGEGPWSDIAKGTPVNPNQPPTRPTLPPLIDFSPSRPTFFVGMIGNVPPSRKLQVWNIRPGPMHFNVSDNADWLTLDPLSGFSSGPTDDEEIDISVDTSNLELGYHRATMEISGAGIENSPQKVRVQLAIGASSFSTSTSYFGSSTSGSVSGDFAERLVVPQDSLPSGATIVVAELDVMPEGAPPADVASTVVWSVNVKAYPSGSDIPYMDFTAPDVELWLGVPPDDKPACSEDRAKLYSVADGSWELVEHSCGTDNDRTYVISSLMSVTTLALAVEMNYDTNRDGRIDRDEIIRAISDYFDGLIDRDRVLSLIQRYFSDPES